MARVNHGVDYREDGDSKFRLKIIEKVPCVCCENNHMSSWLPSSCLSCSRSIHSIWIPSAKTLFGFIAAFLLGVVVCSRWNEPYSDGNGLRLPWSMNYKSLTSPFEDHTNFSQESKLHHRTNFTCPNSGGNLICTSHRREQSVATLETGSRPACPEYFRWIHEDFRPWRDTGITQEMVEAGRQFAHFRLVVVDGRAYVQHYAKPFQTRDVFTLWGILQLLRLHGGRLPDLDLLFDCNDTPRILAAGYRQLKKEASMPPPVFRYCGEIGTVQIVFPDWSFWGWPEVNIKPWETLLEELKEGRRKRKWVDREPSAFWKGNPLVSNSRKDLLNCNASHGQDWNARIFIQIIDMFMDVLHHKYCTTNDLVPFVFTPIFQMQYFVNLVINATESEFDKLEELYKEGLFMPELDKIFTVIHTRNHWHLLVTDFKVRKFLSYNSMKGTKFHKKDVLKWHGWISEYLMDSIPDDCLAGWEIIYVQDCPQQPSQSLDCGIYVMKMMEYLCEGRALDFTYDDIDRFRSEIASLLLTCGHIENSATQ